MNISMIIEKTYELIDTIKISDSYKAYSLYEKKVLSDNNLRQLLLEFQNKKEKFEDAYKYKDYYPDYNKIKDDYQQIKISLMNNQIFKTYKSSEKELDLYINEIEYQLKQIVNLEEKHGKPNIRLF